MMGYASLSQTDSGLHMRQFARAFVVAASGSSATTDRILFVNTDTAMGDNGVRRRVLQAIAADSTLSKFYNDQNFALIGTHQHSGVGGYLENLLPQVTSLGYVNQTAQAIVDGVLSAARAAHASLASGTLSTGNTTLMDTNKNRSPTAYLANPASERAQYQFDQDKDFNLINFKGSDGNSRGFLGFFAVHGTSIYENNTLVSSDNKGYAAYLAESAHAAAGELPGKTKFVAGFIQGNVGDTSPNTLGAFCESPGQPWDGQACEAEHSTCGNKTEDCHGRGPAFTQDAFGFASNAIIGTNQNNAASSLLSNSGLSSISGSVRSVHIFVNMSQYTFNLANGTTVNTCPPAMGFSFAGGTTDGPGAFDFVQGDNSSQPQNPFWELVKGVITPAPSAQQVACQGAKPILLNTGYAHTPYDWSPSTVNIQLMRVGQVFIIVMPGELTTMAGRRLRDTVRQAITSSSAFSSVKNPIVLIAGPANTYSHYVTTREEYGVQRYEGASTIYGPFTLEAYQDIFSKLVPYLADTPPSSAPHSDAAPPDQSGSYISLQTPVVFDTAPSGKTFGAVLTDVSKSYNVGQTASAQFVGANPRNNLRLGGTFLTVDVLNGNTWSTIRTDAHPSTTYQWLRTSTILGTSSVTVNWTIEAGTPSGTYRLTYNGDSKTPVIGTINTFKGISSNFTVSG